MVKKETITMEEKLDLVSDILNGDILISLKSNKGVFDSNNTRVYIKDEKAFWKQVGLIQKFVLSADCEDNIVDVTTTFPEHPKLSVTVKKSIKEYSTALTKLGVKVKKERIKE